MTSDQGPEDASVSESQESASKDVEAKKKANDLSWSRYFARSIDFAIYGLIVRLVIIYGLPQIRNLDEILIQFVYMSMLFAVTAFVEPFLLMFFGTTFGKFSFGLSIAKKTREEEVRVDPKNIYAYIPPPAQGLDYATLVKRNLSMIANGCGLLLPIVSLITMSRSRRTLREKGQTPWDEKYQFEISRESYSAVNLLACVTALILVAGLYSSHIINFSTLTRQEYSPKLSAKSPVSYWQNPITSTTVQLPAMYTLSNIDNLKGDDIVGQFTRSSDQSIFVVLVEEDLKKSVSLNTFVNALILAKKEALSTGAKFFNPENVNINGIEAQRFIATKRLDGVLFTFEYVAWTIDNRTFWHTMAFTDTESFNLGLKGRDMVETLVKSTATFSH